MTLFAIVTLVLLALGYGDTWAKCDDCGQLLTPEEIHYYENRCNDCELAWLHRIGYWMDGGPDPELDKLYGEEDK